MKIRQLTEAGNAKFKAWLDMRAPGEQPPQELLDGLEDTKEFLDREIDIDRTFDNRLEFGRYLVEVFRDLKAQALLAEKNDGMWNWLTVAFFRQVGKKMSKSWHYCVTRRGHSGSLAYRHLVRTSYEMYWRHGDKSLAMLSTDLGTWGEMSEQLTSRQYVAHHQGFIAAAGALYLRDGRLVKGAASRLKPVKKRMKGDKSGRGNVARLALAVRRLCRTYDTHALREEEMLRLLPREFSRFVPDLQAHGISAVQDTK